MPVRSDAVNAGGRRSRTRIGGGRGVRWTAPRVAAVALLLVGVALTVFMLVAAALS